MNQHPVLLHALGSNLTRLDDDRIRRVVALIDAMAERGAVDRLLDSLRPRLGRLRPPRPLTIGRVLVLPFEDLLVPAGTTWTDGPRIRRDVLPVLVREVLEGLDPETGRRLAASAETGTMSERERVLDLGHLLWPAAARHLARTAEPERRLVGRLLELAPQLVPAMWRWPPRPMCELREDGAAAALEALRRAATRGQAHLRAVAELLLARADSAEMVLNFLRRSHLGLGAREHAAFLSELTASSLDRLEDGTRHVAEADLPVTEIVPALLRLATDTLALEEGGLDPGQRRQLGAIRRATAQAVAARTEQSIGHDLQQQIASSGDPEVMEAMARDTRRLLLAGSRLGGPFAPASPARRHFGSYAQSVETADTPRQAMERLRIVEILYGPEAAMELHEQLRQRTMPVESGVAGDAATVPS